MFSSIVGLATAFFLRRNKQQIMRDGGIEFAFGLLMVVSASAMAFAHGSNDVANAIGPLAAIVSVVDTGAIGSKAAISPWVLFGYEILKLLYQYSDLLLFFSFMLIRCTNGVKLRLI